MEPIDISLADACPDQRPHLLAFAKTGDPAVLSRIHFESCAACASALDTLELVPEPPRPAPPRYDPAYDPVLCAILVVGGILGVALLSILFIRFAAIPFPERRDHLPFVLAMSDLVFLDFWTMIRLMDARRERRTKTAPD